MSNCFAWFLYVQYVSVVRFKFKFWAFNIIEVIHVKQCPTEVYFSKVIEAFLEVEVTRPLKNELIEASIHAILTLLWAHEAFLHCCNHSKLSELAWSKFFLKYVSIESIFCNFHCVVVSRHCHPIRETVFFQGCL